MPTDNAIGVFDQNHTAAGNNHFGGVAIKADQFHRIVVMIFKNQLPRATLHLRLPFKDGLTMASFGGFAQLLQPIGHGLRKPVACAMGDL